MCPYQFIRTIGVKNSYTKEDVIRALEEVVGVPLTEKIIEYGGEMKTPDGTLGIEWDPEDALDIEGWDVSFPRVFIVFTQRKHGHKIVWYFFMDQAVRIAHEQKEWAERKRKELMARIKEELAAVL